MIYLSPPHLSEKEFIYIQQAMTSNWIAPVGEYLDKLEQSICDFTEVKHCLAVNSGTSAIHLALQVLGIGQGDEVICPTFTFAATANPIIYQNATPIFVDSEPQTWNISPEYLEKAIQDRIKKSKKPKAIMVVHLYGNSAQMADIQLIADRYEIPIIEDAAEALGSTYQNKKLGAFGKLGIYSFNGNKIITTSAGGALVSDDKVLIDKALHLATQAKDTAPHYQHSQIGYNYRLSNILAAIGLGQMEVLPARIEKRRTNFNFYQKALKDFVEFQSELSNSFSNRWLSCVLFNPPLKGGRGMSAFEQREKIRLALQKNEIESRPLWKPLHLQPIFQNFPYYGENIAEDLFNRGLCLPSGSSLKEEELERIVRIIKENLAN